MRNKKNVRFDEMWKENNCETPKNGTEQLAVKKCKQGGSAAVPSKPSPTELDS